MTVACLASVASAQADFDFNWHTMNNGFLGGNPVILSGPALFGFAGSTTGGSGNSIRICYGIDSNQGGRMQTSGAADVSWMAITQGYGALNSPPGADIGLVSIHAASVDSLDGDACMSSLLPQGVDSTSGLPITLRDRVAFSFLPGLQPAIIPFPAVTTTYFQLMGGAVQVPNTLGQQLGSFPAPLLTHLILEIQGPVNGGASNIQYYVASTAENIGLGNGTSGAGGVANGNSRMGSSIFGVSADVSNAVSHNRLTASGPLGFFGTTGTQVGGGAGTDQLWGQLGTQTPQLWAAKNGRTGGGAPDWQISNQAQRVDLRVLDMLAGAQGDLISVPPGPTTQVTDPNLVANFPVFLWSASPAEGMLQSPMSWDTIPGVLAQPGSIRGGSLNTVRGGQQLIPLNIDAMTLAFLKDATITIGSNFQAAQSPLGGSVASLFEDGIGTGINGSAGLAAGPLTLGPYPALANRNIGVAAVGMQLLQNGDFYFTEAASSLTLTIQ